MYQPLWRSRRRAKRDGLPAKPSARRLAAEPLEPRLALSSQEVLGDVLGLQPQRPYPDGLSHANPLVRSAIAGITTSAPAEVFFFAGDLPPAPPATTNIPAAALIEAGELIEMPSFRNDLRFAGIDGAGYSVVVLDTGVDLDHPFFGPDDNGDGVADRIVYNADFITGRPNADDVNGHGTHVSSIIASQDSTYAGMAPAASIIHLRVLNDSGIGTASAIEAALQWTVANTAAYNIASVNMSLSMGDNQTAPSERPDVGLNDELAALAAQGVIVVSASGNSFFQYVSTPGVGYPSADPNSLSVGAVWDADAGGPFNWSTGAADHTTGADRLVSFGQRHPTLTTILAPGALITAAAPGGAVAAFGGTSMAAPHVAGVAALVQQLSVQAAGHRLAVAEFAELLRLTGVPLLDGDDEDDNVLNTQQEFRRLDVLAFANAILYPELADLSIAGELKASAPAVAAGGRARVDFTIANQGRGATDAFTGRFFLSTDAVIDAADLPLAAFSDELAPGSSSRRAGHPVEIPAAVAPGSYYLGVVLDDQSAVAESNEQNNVAVMPITVAADMPEIYLQDLATGAAVLNGNATIDFGQAEAGRADVVRVFRVFNDGSTDLSLAQPAVPEGFSVVTFPASVPPLASVDVAIALSASHPDNRYEGPLSFLTNDVDEAAFAFSITGTVDHGENSGDATLISSNPTVGGALLPADDVDWFRFSAVRNVQYRIETSLGTLSDSLIRLIDANGASELAVDDNGGDGAASALTWTFPADGAYFIEVSGKGRQGSYQLTLTAGDDHGDDALTATATSDPSLNRGALGAAGDVDWFAFAAQAGVPYRFETRLDTLADSVLRLVGPDGTAELAFNDNGPAGLESLIEWTAPDSSLYYVAVGAATPSMLGSYDLLITGVDDHGDNSPNATVVTAPGGAAGDLEEPADVDWFSFTALEGAAYEVATSARGPIDSLLRLIDQDGATELARDDNGGPGAASLIRWTAPESGVYFVEVSAVDQRHGGYELSLNVVDDHADDAAGATATSDPSDNPGVIERPEDADWFSFDAFAGVAYRFETTHGTLPASSLRLIDPDGQTELAASAAAAPLIEWTAPQDGRYFIAVDAADGQIGTYQLAILGDDDHGDNPQNPTPLPVPGNIAGALERPGDDDWFSFTVVDRLGYRFEAASAAPQSPLMRLYEGDGLTQIAAAGGASGAPPVIDWTATQSGTYYLAISEGEAVPAAAETAPSLGYTLHSAVVGRLPGDYDGSERVDGHDLLRWQASLGSTTDLAADGDEDGVVAGPDLDVWRQNFGLALESRFASGAVIAAARQDAAPSDGLAPPASSLPRIEIAARLASDTFDSAMSNRAARRPAITPAAGAASPILPRDRDDALRHWSSDAGRWLQSAAAPLPKGAFDTDYGPASDADEPAGNNGENVNDEFDAAIVGLFARGF